MNEINDRFSYAVIGLAMETHRELGPGLDEIFYHELLATKLSATGIPYRKKPRGNLIHRGILADEFEADLIIGSELALELKVLWGDFAPEHLLQLICYLKFWKLPAGLLFDFGKESLAQKRVPLLESVAQVDVSSMLSESPLAVDRPELGVVFESVRAVLVEHGLGYRDTTYRGLLKAELTFRGVPLLHEPIVSVRGAHGILGETKLGCLVLPGICALHVTALRDSRQAADRAVLQTYLCYLNLPWGLHINFGKHAMGFQYALRPKR